MGADPGVGAVGTHRYGEGVRHQVAHGSEADRRVAVLVVIEQRDRLWRAGKLPRSTVQRDKAALVDRRVKPRPRSRRIHRKLLPIACACACV